MPLDSYGSPSLLLQTHDTHMGTNIFIWLFFFPFTRLLLEENKEGNAAFLNIGNVLSHICDSTKTANNKWYLLSDFCIPGIISHALYVVCHVTFKIILWGTCYYFYSYLQVWKLRFRKERKLPQCHVASNWGLGPKTGRHSCLRLFSLSQTQWFFLLRVSRCYLGSHVPGLRGCVLIGLASFGNLFTPCHWWRAQPWLQRFTKGNLPWCPWETFSPCRTVRKKAFLFLPISVLWKTLYVNHLFPVRQCKVWKPFTPKCFCSSEAIAAWEWDACNCRSHHFLTREKHGKHK